MNHPGQKFRGVLLLTTGGVKKPWVGVDSKAPLAYLSGGINYDENILLLARGYLFSQNQIMLQNATRKKNIKKKFLLFFFFQSIIMANNELRRMA
jgi:hypothetical protein